MFTKAETESDKESVIFPSSPPQFPVCEHNRTLTHTLFATMQTPPLTSHLASNTRTSIDREGLFRHPPSLFLIFSSTHSQCAFTCRIHHMDPHRENTINRHSETFRPEQACLFAPAKENTYLMAVLFPSSYCLLSWTEDFFGQEA